MPVRSVGSSSTSQTRAKAPTQLETIKDLTLKASAKPERTRAGLELTFASKRGEPTIGLRARGDSLYLVTDGKGKQLEGADLKAAATKLKSLARGATGELKDTLKHFADVADGKTQPANTGWTPRGRTVGGRGSDVSTPDSRERIANMYTGGRGSDQSTARSREAIARIYSGGTGSGSSYGSSYGSYSGYSSGGRGS